MVEQIGDKNTDTNLLKALLDLRMVLGELQFLLTTLDEAVVDLMKVVADIKSKNSH